MNRDRLRDQLVRDEGIRLSAYQDTRGYWTIGVGRLIDGRLGGGITRDEAMDLLEHDIDRTQRAVRERWPWFDGLDEVRQRVLLNMAFNLGLVGLAKFRHTLHAIEHGRYQQASEHMLDSLWATQVGPRAQRLARMMRTGADDV